ncbi:hypothetical protein HF521_006493 [Silurus meridionalis]|uniref:G-protein coupled receptors family 1 profile domain-containing protein n=1 Tax=Silurus meridionalis TaxID=175797 RepID=A0A8T0AYN6_SILME|nr:hypothetical protein HF521_006493 [Silurus meridionalis]
MTALGAERYVGVCFPLRARLLVTRGRVRVLIGALWGVAALSAGPVLVLVGAEPVDGNLTECRVTRWAESSGLMVAMLWLSNLYFIVPLTTLTLLYTLIARRLRQRRHVPRDHAHRQTLRMMAPPSTLCSTTSCPPVTVTTSVPCFAPAHDPCRPPPLPAHTSDQSQRGTQGGTQRGTQGETQGKRREECRKERSTLREQKVFCHVRAFTSPLLSLH